MRNTDKQLAREAAMEAGRRLRAQREHWNIVTADFAHDVKLQADREAESVILDLLRKNSPYPILAEESGEVGMGAGAAAGSEHLCWIVDPLDGTVNYASGVPLSAVSIGLWRGPAPVYGVIYDFWRDELFEGGPAQGALLNGNPIHASAIAIPARAMFATGSPGSHAADAEALPRWMRNIARYRKIRMFGSAALSLAYVACGRIDVYAEHVMLWDAAAGAALVTGAGGSVTVTPSSSMPHACQVMAAACPALLAPLQAEDTPSA
ncbi:MAG: inositol monophosphatase family protein [Kiritimatiellia bacterium]